MDPCAIETGLLRKKPCGHAGVTQCLNCERPLCAKHAVAQLTDSGKKSGKFLCQECHAAWREIAKDSPPAPAKPPAAPAKPPAAPAKAPAAPAAPTPAQAKPAEAKPADDEDSGSIEFTPSDKK
jgi:hypothetical protein